MNRITPRSPLVAALALVLVVTACSAPDGDAPATDPPTGTIAATPSVSADGSGAPSDAPASEAPADELLAVELTDVRSGETFVLGELAATDGPVVLESMAVWCTTCLAQQREVVQAHADGAFTSVSLDVDLTETPEMLADYADREGFDWRFATADEELYRLLQDRFGVAATHPPSTPIIVIERDGTVRPLEFGRGVRSAEQLRAEVTAGG